MMKAIHWLAVQAPDKDAAFKEVRESLQKKMRLGWYDNFVPGALGWPRKELAGFEEEWAKYNLGDANLVISAAEDLKAFEDGVKAALEQRKIVFDEMVSKVDFEAVVQVISSFDPRELDKSTYAKIYQLTQCINSMTGVWNENSIFYDLKNSSNHAKFCLDSARKDPSRWHLVPVDFHW